MSDVVVLRKESIVTLIQGQPTSPSVGGGTASSVVIKREGIPGVRGEQGIPGITTTIFTGNMPEVIDGGNF